MRVGFDKQKSWKKREKKLENREEEVIISSFEVRIRRSRLTTSSRYRDLIDTQSLASFITAPGTAQTWLSVVVCLGLEQPMFGSSRFRHRTACCVLHAPSPAKSETIKYQLFWGVSERMQGVISL